MSFNPKTKESFFVATSKVAKLTLKKQKNTMESDDVKEFHEVEIYDKDNRLIDGDTINSRDLMSIRCYIKYWKHLIVSKRHV
jgi:hypothetical protein